MKRKSKITKLKVKIRGGSNSSVKSTKKPGAVSTKASEAVSTKASEAVSTKVSEAVSTKVSEAVSTKVSEAVSTPTPNSASSNSFKEKISNHLTNSKKKLMDSNEVSKKIYEKMINRVNKILASSPPDEKCGRLKYLKKLTGDNIKFLSDNDETPETDDKLNSMKREFESKYASHCPEFEKNLEQNNRDMRQNKFNSIMELMNENLPDESIDKTLKNNKIIEQNNTSPETPEGNPETPEGNPENPEGNPEKPEGNPENNSRTLSSLDTALQGIAKDKPNNIEEILNQTTTVNDSNSGTNNMEGGEPEGFFKKISRKMADRINSIFKGGARKSNKKRYKKRTKNRKKKKRRRKISRKK